MNEFCTNLMNAISNKVNKDVICWFPGEDKFTIINKDAFTDEIIPQHFKRCKFESFVRKRYPEELMAPTNTRLFVTLCSHVTFLIYAKVLKTNVVQNIEERQGQSKKYV